MYDPVHYLCIQIVDNCCILLLFVFVLVLEKSGVVEKPVVGGPMATSCATLKHLTNGFYLVKAPSNNKIIVIYCDFTKAPGSTGK